MQKSIYIAGAKITPGVIVRVVGIPSLDGMTQSSQRKTRAVFQHILSRVKRVQSIDERGLVELQFKILNGPLRGLHIVMSEPHLLRMQRGQT
jgi:hypothetical protein